MKLSLVLKHRNPHYANLKYRGVEFADAQVKKVLGHLPPAARVTIYPRPLYMEFGPSMELTIRPISGWTLFVEGKRVYDTPHGGPGDLLRAVFPAGPSYATFCVNITAHESPRLSVEEFQVGFRTFPVDAQGSEKEVSGFGQSFYCPDDDGWFAFFQRTPDCLCGPFPGRHAAISNLIAQAAGI